MCPTLERFLCLVQGAGLGFTELRLLPEPRDGAHYPESHYFRSPYAAAAWWRTRGAEANIGHGVYFGVARRCRPPQRFKAAGRDADVAALACLWSDLDWKDYGGGETEARERLLDMRPAPTVVVCSGGGFHAYWCLRRPMPPDVGRRLMRRLALALASDATVCNPARVLRLPGSLRLKDPRNPKLVEVRGWMPGLRYDEHAFDTLPRLPDPPRSPTPEFRPAAPPQPGSREHRYAQAALRKTCERLESVPKGERHRRLFSSAIRLGEFVGVGLLDRKLVEDYLFYAIKRTGYDDDRDARRAIEDGLARGLTQVPRIPTR